MPPIPTADSSVKPKIIFDAPDLGPLEKSWLTKAVDSGYVSSVGPYVSEFEEQFSLLLNGTKAVAVQNGTAAIHLALHELGIGPEDEVIVPVLTFIATVNPIRYVGATPVFVDVDPKTWNLDTLQIKAAITKKTKAILLVHLFGNPCQMDEIKQIAQEFNLYVIEDATESLGASFNGIPTGRFGDLGCFSFNGNKTITTGAGGMVVGDDRSRLDHIKYLANQARDNVSGYFHSEIGFNYRMTNLEAALGLAQLSRLSEFLTKKKEFYQMYRQELGSVSVVSFQEVSAKALSSHWITGIILDRQVDVVHLQKELETHGVPVRRMFTPVVEFPPYRPFAQKEFPAAMDIYHRALGLPNSTLNSKEDIQYVCDVIKEILR